MSQTSLTRHARNAVHRGLGFEDLRAALAAGWADFVAFPLFGLFFAGFYVGGGLFISLALLWWGEPGWLIPAAAGFPLLAPFVAVGLYEVSRRREAGLPMEWRAVLGALRGRGDDQILAMGVILFVAFAFWLMVAHGIFAVFLSDASMGSDPTALLATPAGIAMIAVGSAVGGAMAWAFYTMTVTSLPMLVDREVDFITAVITSVRTVRLNRAVMAAWAFGIAATLVLAILPLFLGLLVAMPVLGHATWHLYRRLVMPL